MAKSFTMGQKLFMGAGALVVSTLLGTAYSAVVMRGLSSALSMAAEVRELENSVAESAEMLGLERAMVLHAIFDQKEEVERYKQEFQKVSQELDGRLQRLSATSISPESLVTLRTLSEAQTSWKSSHTELLSFLSGQKVDLAQNLLKERIAPTAEKMHKAADERSESAARSMEAERQSAAIKSATSAAILVGLCLFIGGAVLLQIRRTTSKLHRISEALAESARQVADAANQVSHSSHSLAQGATQQAASLQETSASSEEISSMSRKNAEAGGCARAARPRLPPCRSRPPSTCRANGIAA